MAYFRITLINNTRKKLERLLQFAKDMGSPRRIVRHGHIQAMAITEFLLDANYF